MRQNSFLPFDPLLRLYRAEFGMQRIYPLDLGRVTKVGLLDRGAPPRSDPVSSASDSPKRRPVSVHIPQGRIFCGCIQLTAGVEAPASAAA